MEFYAQHFGYFFYRFNGRSSFPSLNITNVSSIKICF